MELEERSGEEEREASTPTPHHHPPGLGWSLGRPLAGTLGLRDLVLAGVSWLASIASS